MSTERKIFNITVTDSEATFLARQGRIVCGNDKYRIHFTFDSEWDGQDAKIARFNYAGMHTDVEFTGNEVDVPVISGATSVEVGVYTEDGPFTTTGAIIPCELSILCKPSAASPELNKVYLDEARRLVQEARDILENIGDGEGLRGVTEALESVTGELDGKLDKVTDAGGALRAYTVKEDGSQKMTEVTYGITNSYGMIAGKLAGGIVPVGTPTAATHAVPLGFANEHYVPIITGTGGNRLYGVNPSGKQTEFGAAFTNYPFTLPMRDENFTFTVGEPTQDAHPATKKYVDTQLAAVARATPRQYIDWVKDIESQFWIEDDGEVYEHNRGTYIFGEGRYDVYVGFDTDDTKGVATFEPFCIFNPDFDTDDFNLNQITVTGDTNAVSVYVDRNCSDFTYCPVMSFNRTTDAMPEHFLLDIEEYKREGRVQLLIHVRHIAPEPD